jgi:xanthine dehydrogenase accessory factor
MEDTMTAQETHKTEATDPVCGMTVNIASARASGLTTDHKGHAYYFCGRGCKLEFEDDPEKYLDRGYRPSM